MNLIDLKTNQLVDVTNPEVALQSGQFSFPSDGKIALFDPQAKEVFSADQKDLPDLFKAGIKLADPSQIEQARKVKKYGNSTLSPVLAGFSDWFSGGIAPLTAKVAAGAGSEAGKTGSEWYEENRKQHPYLYGTGAALSFIPGMFTGEAGAATKLLTGGASEAVNMVGHGAEKAVGGYLADKAIPQVIKKYAPQIGNMAAQGALYGADRAVIDKALSDPEYTAEKLFSTQTAHEIFNGGLIGLGTGAALGTVGAAIKPSIQALSPWVGKTADFFGIPKSFGEFADNAAARMTNYGVPELKSMEGSGITPRIMGQALREKGVLFGTDEAYKANPLLGEAAYPATQKTAQKVIDAKLDYYGSKIGEVIKNNDHVVDLLPLRERLYDQVVSKLADQYVTEPEANRIIETIKDVVKNDELPLSKLKTVVNKYGDKASFSITDTPNFKNYMGQVRGISEGFIKEQIAKIGGEEQASIYQQLKDKYNAFINASKGLDKTLRKGVSSANSSFQLKSTSLTGMGLNALKSVADPVAGAVAHYVDSIGLLQDTTNTFQSALSHTINGLTEYGERVAPAAAAKIGFLIYNENHPNPIKDISFHDSKDLPGNATPFEKQMHSITELNSNPDLLKNKVMSNLSDLYNVSPEIAQATAMKSAMMVKYLADNLPKPANSLYQNPISKQKWEPSQLEQKRFENILKATNNPFNVLNDMSSKKVLPAESLQTVKDLYPRMYHNAIGQIMDNLSKSDKTIPYQKQLLIDRFMGTNFVNRNLPISPPMSPSSMAPSIGHQKMKSSGISKMKSSDRSLTMTQNLMSK